MSWGVQSLQAVWWSTQPIQQQPAVIFQGLVGSAATSIQTNPGAALAIATAAVDQSAYRLQVQGNRLDYFVVPNQPDRLPLFENVNNTIDGMQARLTNASQFVGDCVRLALVVNILEPAGSQAQANRTVAELAGINLPDADAGDLVLQINKRKALGVPNVEFNRLLRWASEVIQHIEVSGGAPSVKNFEVVTLSVDVNVAPTPNRTFNNQEQNTIFAVMVAEVKKLCATRSMASLFGQLNA